MVLLEQALLEHEMSASAWNDTLLGLWVVHLTDVVRVDSCTVDNDLGFDGELFALRIEFVDTDASDDVSLIIFHEGLKFDVVGQSCSSHAWDEAIHSCSEQTVEVHAAVMHLRLLHHGPVPAIQHLHLRVLLAKQALSNDAGPRDADLVV